MWKISDIEGDSTRSQAARHLLAKDMRVTFTLSGGSPATADGGALLFDVVTFNPSQAAEETSAFPGVDWSELANAWLATCEGYEERGW